MYVQLYECTSVTTEFKTIPYNVPFSRPKDVQYVLCVKDAYFYIYIFFNLR